MQKKNNHLQGQQALIVEMAKGLKRQTSFTLKVNRYYTDANGQVLDKNTVANNLKVSFPFYLFNKFDKEGGYRIGNIILPPIQNTFYLYSYCVGSSFDYFQFSGRNSVRHNCRNGDLVLLFADSAIAFNVLIWVVISSDFQSVNSLINSMPFHDVDILEILYRCDNIDNYNEAIHFVKENVMGEYKADQFQPLSFKTPNTVLNDFITLKIPHKISEFAGLYSYFRFATDNISFNFKVNI